MNVSCKRYSLRPSHSACFGQLVESQCWTLRLPELQDSESIMQKSPLFALFIVLSVGVSLSQSLNDSPSGAAVDCSDPSRAGSAECAAAQAQRSGTQGRDDSTPSERIPQLKTPAGFNTDQKTPPHASAQPLANSAAENPTLAGHRVPTDGRRLGRPGIAIVRAVVVRPASKHVCSHGFITGSE